MREHKYRKWNFENNTMIDSDSLAFEEYAPISDLLTQEGIMEYTGIPDKDKADICEDDILHIEIIDSNIGKVVISVNKVVEYQDGMFGVKWGVRREFMPLSGFSKQYTKFTVVGNKFDNPELLKEASKDAE